MLIEGYKFDLRIYIVMTSCDPLTLYIFDDGIVRMSTELYEQPNKENLKNLYQHLTNYSINKYSEKFYSSSDPNNDEVGFKRSLNFLKKMFK